MLQRELAKLDGAGGAVEGETFVWHEIGRVEARTKALALELAQNRHPEVRPLGDGESERLQLVPSRFWRELTLTARVGELRIEVDGL